MEHGKEYAVKTLLLDKEIDKDVKLSPDNFYSAPIVKEEKQAPIEEKPVIKEIPKQVAIEPKKTILNQIQKATIANIQAKDYVQEDAETTPKKSPKFRLKVVAVAYALALAVCGGWAIGNAIAINNNAAQIVVTQKEYDVNFVEYMLKIDSLDNFTEPTEPADGELNLIGNVVTIVPSPLKEEVPYDKSSNWFDNICNWISGIFGG